MLDMDITIPLFDLVAAISKTINLLSNRLSNHQKSVACIASSIAQQTGLPHKTQQSLIIAGYLHDIGAVSLKEQADLLNFEVHNPHIHAEIGYYALKDTPMFHDIAEIIRYHHIPWKLDKNCPIKKKIPVLKLSDYIFLADRIEILINKKQPVLQQVNKIVDVIKEHKGTMFAPHLVDAFCELAKSESFWLDAVSPSINEILLHKVPVYHKYKLKYPEVLNVVEVLSQINDFKSPFTAEHSAGVAISAEALTKLFGFSKRECALMKIAGYLHDLGKFAVPNEILDKPGKLTAEEFNIIKSHTYHTYDILSCVPDFKEINEWASLHHEKLDGTGYPFHVPGEDCSFKARIMMVADIFTALRENRPYRAGLPQTKVLKILNEMVQKKLIDGRIVNMLKNNYKNIAEACATQQEKTKQKYDEFRKSIEKFSTKFNQ
jgi:HD-GYP domain-containing protein (c-di-GMP phosphodiesterase class II)